VNPLTASYGKRIADFAAGQQLPSLHGIREFVAAGGLMSYGASLADLSRRAAYYVDKIFKGAKPADLPVQQPTKFELVINLKTAKALGLGDPYGTSRRFVVTRKFGRYWRHSRPERAFSPDQLGRK
jgi:putative ABC transport system substrate-binding protein